MGGKREPRPSRCPCRHVPAFFPASQLGGGPPETLTACASNEAHVPLIDYDAGGLGGSPALPFPSLAAPDPAGRTRGRPATSPPGGLACRRGLAPGRSTRVGPDASGRERRGPGQAVTWTKNSTAFGPG